MASSPRRRRRRAADRHPRRAARRDRARRPEADCHPGAGAGRRGRPHRGRAPDLAGRRSTRRRPSDLRRDPPGLTASRVSSGHGAASHRRGFALYPCHIIPATSSLPHPCHIRAKVEPGTKPNQIAVPPRAPRLNEIFSFSCFSDPKRLPGDAGFRIMTRGHSGLAEDSPYIGPRQGDPARPTRPASLRRRSLSHVDLPEFPGLPPR